MSKTSTVIDRAVRIELLRARAAVEREVLAQNMGDLGVALSPTHIVKGLLPNLADGNSSRLAMQAVSLVRRYPFILSGLSTLFLGGNKRSKFLKLATGAVVGWQAYRAWLSTRGRAPDKGAADAGVPPAL